jgi:hypothetical protein
MRWLMEIKRKGKVLPVQASEVYRGSRVAVRLICNHGTRQRRLISFVPCRFIPGKGTSVKLEQDGRRKCTLKWRQ